MDVVPFRLELTGDTSEEHQFQGYDGYTALAGFALTLSLITHYAETGKIRHRGDFLGRDAVRAYALTEGSIVANFKVWLEDNPASVLRLNGSGYNPSSFLNSLVKRVVGRNIGQEEGVEDPLVRELIDLRGGDVEALVARTEAPIRQAHSVIGKGALSMDIMGGFNVLNNFNEDTREYVRANIEDRQIRIGYFSVNAFAANQGSGGVFDPGLGRSVPISMSKEVLGRVKSIFSWGLDQYANRTGGTVRMRYTRVLAMDQTPKKYRVLSAQRG